MRLSGFAVPLFACAVAIAALPAQRDLIGLTATGQVVAFDSHTGAGGLLTTNTEVGAGAMARSGSLLFATERTVQATFPPTIAFHLGHIDAQTGGYTRAFANTGDLRGLADHPTNRRRLLAIRDGTPDELVAIDTFTGVVSVIGPTGRTGIQALATHGGTVFGWDVVDGLVRIDLANGRSTDVNTQVIGSTAVQFLLAHTDGRLLGGRQVLFEIDPTNGILAPIGALAGGTFDVIGAEERFPLAEPFGSGCIGGNGQTSLLSSGGAAPGQTLLLTCRNHEAQRLGVLVLGFDAHAAQGQPLPLPLDPLLGTAGCQLLVSPDLTAVGLTSATGAFVHPVALPLGIAFTTFHAQVAVFESVPGGTSWSNALLLKIAP
jgi:hypothetical protein